MSVGTVRTAVSAFIAPPNVTGLNKVYAAMPNPIPATDYTAGQYGLNWGAVGVVHVARAATRLRSGGNTGAHLERSAHYVVDIVLVFRDTSGDFVQAQQNHDAMQDALRARLTSDPTLGTTGSQHPILFGGLGTSVPGVSSGEDLILTQDLPKQDRGSFLKWSRMQLTNVVEVYVGTSN